MLYTVVLSLLVTQARPLLAGDEGLSPEFAATRAANAEQWYQRTASIDWHPSATDARAFLKDFEQQFQAAAQKQLGFATADLQNEVGVVAKIGMGSDIVTSEATLIVHVKPKSDAQLGKVAKFVEAQMSELKKQAQEHAKEMLKRAVAEAKQGVVEREKFVSETEQKVSSIRSHLADSTGQINPSAGEIQQAASQMQQQFQQAELDHQAKEARRKAIEEAIAELAHKAESKVKDDPIVSELQKVVEVRERELSRQKELQQNKASSSSDVDQAVVAAAEARAKVLERKREAAAEAGGPLMEQLNKDLLTLSIDSAEQTMRYEILRKRCDALRAGFKDAQTAEKLEANRFGAEQMLPHDRRAVEELEKKLKEEPTPIVSIRDGEFVEAPADYLKRD
jgi:hypothetical protein